MHTGLRRDRLPLSVPPARIDKDPSHDNPVQDMSRLLVDYGHKFTTLVWTATFSLSRLLLHYRDDAEAGYGRQYGYTMASSAGLLGYNIHVSSFQ